MVKKMQFHDINLDVFNCIPIPTSRKYLSVFQKNVPNYKLINLCSGCEENNQHSQQS